DRREIALVELHYGSLIACTRFASGAAISEILPEGQRTVTFSILAIGPSPKWRRRWFCAQNPEPPETSWTCCCPFQCTVTRAPMALRFEQVRAGSASLWQRPVRSNAIQPRSLATSFLYSSSGPRW